MQIVTSSLSTQLAHRWAAHPGAQIHVSVFLAGEVNDAVTWIRSHFTSESHNSSVAMQSECYLASHSHLTKYCFFLGLFLRQWSSQSLGLDQFPDSVTFRDKIQYFFKLQSWLPVALNLADCCHSCAVSFSDAYLLRGLC